MRPLLVAGNVNVETVFHLSDNTFPLEVGYFPGAIQLNVSGVGANLTRALRTLGSPVRLLTFGANDDAGRFVRANLGGIETHFAQAKATPQSLALVRMDGQHTFYRDLKQTPERPAPVTEFETLLSGCAAALLSNIGWTRELLSIAQAAGVPILSDVQDLRGLDNRYDAPYFSAADVLFLSAAHLGNPAETLRHLSRLSPAQVIVAGMGQAGSLLLERGSNELHHQPAFAVQAASQGGAGDALAGAFAHFYFTRALNAPAALRLACAAAALKLRTSGSGRGHPTEAEVDGLVSKDHLTT